MTESTPSRRRVLVTGLAGALCAVGGVGPTSGALAAPIFPRPFAGSRTVANFASQLILLDHDEVMPPTLRRAIEAELARRDVEPDGAWQERLRADFLARLAARTIAPRALRRAGWDALAANCESGLIAPASAQHTIGHYRNDPLSDLSWLAYRCCAFAATAKSYAAAEDSSTVIEAGKYCAWALYDCEEIPSSDIAWIWSAAIEAINNVWDYIT